MTVVDPDSDNLVTNDLGENDIEIVVIIQIADGNVQRAVRRLKVEELRLLLRKMKFYGVVVSAGTMANAIGNCEIRLPVRIKICNCRGPAEWSGCRTQTKTLGLQVRCGLSSLRQNDEGREQSTNHELSHNSFLSLKGRQRIHGFGSGHQVNFSSCEQTIY